MLCSRCKKRMAIVFVSRMDSDKPVNEGYCLQCAKEIGIPHVKEMIDKLGISDDDLDNITGQMSSLLGDEEDFEPGGAMPMPSFLQHFMTSINGESADGEEKGKAPLVPAPEKKNESRGAAKEEAPRKKYKFLDQYCENLTAKAKAGKIDNIIGREDEIYRVMQILNRRQKNNPCLIGEPGVGKTAIVEGIAQQLADGSAPPRLADKQLYLLDLTGLVAGTQFRGQFESRVKGLISDIKAAGNVILFIDEVHSIIGAGDAEGSMNAANILKPALSRGEIQVIGATTFTEYRKHIEKDAALERRFQPVKVGEPSIEDAKKVLCGIKKYYESYHRVKVSDEVINLTVEMSERYITDRFLPDKAIDLLDEACSCCTLDNKELVEYENKNRRYKALETEESTLTQAAEPDFARLAEIRSEKLRLEDEIKAIEPLALGREVTEEDLARVIELWTGIPASKIKQSELSKVANLADVLKKHIIGQDEAVKLVSDAVRRTRIQLSEKKRPASFIFVGPTGVGKTELVKRLAAELFDAADPLIRVDMSEFMEKHAVSRLVGSPPGYVGYDEAGQLTEKVRRKPYSVVLFDEIEKAHPDVLNILLQILDEGRITDAQGRVVSFENTVIVMTSNAGSNIKGSALGFEKTENDASRERAMKALSEFLRPEFLARVDEIVCFGNLTKDNFRDIAALMLDEYKKPLSNRGIKFGYDDKALQLIAEKAFGKRSGARDVRTVIRREVEDNLTLLLVEKASEQPALVSVTAENGELKLITA
ncbi:MAG: ATP-dependent Clp protease ATP-binding subunit [Oscillospiraceae bacterium]|nr:ATP-dependent Clp protease ATP-binding subunit [Oscillospiraceae bacterium]